MSYNKSDGFILSIRANKKFHFGIKCVAFVFLVSSVPTSTLYGLTSGPSQPEASDFTPAGVDNLVDPFTGDFSYNIPLLEIGGYPINLAYSAGITMDQEASWVGLGWNVSTGAINRTLRGLPDDFNGDVIRNSFNMRDNITVSAGVDASGEAWGVPFPGSMGGEIVFNNYNGLSLGTSVSLSTAIAEGASSKMTGSLGLKASGNGLDISPGLSFSGRSENERDIQNRLKLNIGMPMNSRQGLSQLSFGTPINLGVKRQLKKSKSNTTLSLRTSFNMGANITFASPAVTPNIQHPFITHAFTFRGSLGLAAFGIDGDISIRGTYSKQALRVKEKSVKSYGCLNLQYGQQFPKAKLDFSRDKDGTFSMTTPYLPQTTLAYDIFTLDAQGLGGSFRAFRNDYGYVFDEQEKNLSLSGALALELSTAQLIDVGGEIDVNVVESQSGAWKSGNLNISDLRYRKSEPNDIREPWHFRLSNELTAESDPTYINLIGGRSASHFDNPNVSTLSKKWRNRLGNTGNVDNNYRNARQQRNTMIAYYSVGQLRALYPHIAKNIDVAAPRHQLGAFVITTAEGVRYVFGLPAYNWVTNEITFSQGRTNPNSSLQLSADGTQITYNPTDVSILNKRGIDHFYDEVETPAYAYTWYLTEILSPDYVDVTGDGPSEDDLGTYTYFHYGVEQTNGSNLPNISKYKWRTPTSSATNRAGYSKGLLTDITDDKANIVYGEKDIWYLRMIESKTQVAVFVLSNRDDGYGVANIHGGIGSAPQKKLDEIRLYVKEDYQQNGANAVPTKSVHFEYDYSLCPGVPNNPMQGGKLTLKKVYFTFKGEGRSKFSPYKFAYSSVNPSYSTSSSDRWGNYRPWSPPLLKHEDYPYSNQNKPNSDIQASAWNLTEIETPAGGKITVSYEADTYAYVQNKQASAMFMAVGFTENIDSQNPAQGVSPALMDGLPFLTPRTYLHIDLSTFAIDGNLSSAIATKKFKDDFVIGWDNLPKGPKKHLYFRFLMNVNSGLNEKHEFVSGYVEPELQAGQPIVGVYKHSSSDYNRAWIKLKEVPVEGSGSGGGANPIAKAAWQFSRMYTPRYALNQPDPTDSAADQIIKTLANAMLFYQIFEFFQGPNGSLRNKGFGNVMKPNQSWVRLYVPNGQKVGGGHRVKQVQIDDNWGTMTNPTESNTAASYGQQYFYDLEDGKSSGVAAWEPGIGADENSWRVPIFFDTHKALMPSEKFYQEEPLLESQFPGPTVGYSRVKVRSLPHSGVSTTATGYTIHEFYTAKDFPTRVEVSKQTQPRRQKSSPILSLLYSSTFDRVSHSQGFLIELNDMHGKEKATFTYPEGSTIPISGSRYFYKKDAAGNLSNQVSLFRTDGTAYSGEIGVDVDFVADFREHETVSTSLALAGNVAFFLVGPFPVCVITVIPKVDNDEKVFRLATSNKIVRRAGILERVETFDLGAKVVKENEGYDALSGKLLLERVNNAYEDTRYASTIPAYWAYSRMGHASTNWGYRFTFNPPTQSVMNFNPNTGQLVGQAYDVLIPGDEISFPRAVKDPDFMFFMAPNNSHTYRLWVAQESSGSKYLIDAQGNIFNTANSLWPTFQFVRQMQVIRSGNRNQPLAHIQKAETMHAPLTASGSRLYTAEYQGILSISSMEYDEFWKNNDNRLYNYKDTLGLVCIPYPHVQRTIELLNAVISDPTISLGSPNAPYINLSQIFPHLTNNLIGGPSSNPYYFNTGTLWHAGYFDTTQGDWENPCVSYMNFLRADNSLSLTPAEIANLTGFDIGPVFHLPPNLNPYQNLNWWYDGTVLDFFSVIAHFNDGSTLPMYIVFDECNLVSQECEFVVADFPCLTLDSAIVNPYLYGLLGNWRPVKTYAYLTERGPSPLPTAARLREAGTYLNFLGTLWTFPTTLGMPWTKSTVTAILEKWQLANEIANYNQFGAEIENKDALGNFTAALYGYKHTLPVGVASNARYQEIAFDGFEDYYPGQFVDSCDIYHFKFTPYKHLISTNTAHSGRHSLRIPASQTVELYSQVSPQLPRRQTYSVPYRIWPEDLLGFWRPRETNTSQRYVCSFWIRPDTSNVNMLLTYQNDFSVGIDVNTTALNPVFQNWGPIIEGWQQVETHFIFPTSLTNGDVIRFFVQNNTSSQAYFFDDFRLQPFNSSMMAYVYDPVDFMYMASLDENNFASFYEYDKEGKLVRVKKETQRGISTLQEIRNNRPKKP